MSTILYFFALLAFSNARVISANDTVVASPVSRTSIVGPSGSIHKEEFVPVIGRRYAASAPVVPAVQVSVVEVAQDPAPLPVIVSPTIVRTYPHFLYKYIPAQTVLVPVLANSFSNE